MTVIETPPAGAPQRPAGAEAPRQLVRVREGRWLGGVCAGVAPARALKVGWVRLAFVLAAALGGLGLVAYAAAWLIVPLDGREAELDGRRGPVVVAQACGGCAVLAVLAGAGAGATIFGFGWVVTALAGTGLAVALIAWGRINPAWALPALSALTLPSLAVAAAGLRLAPQSGQTVIAPAALRGATYRSGLGTLMIDLRHTRLPAAGSVPLHIEAGVARTIVALPHDRCVHVQVSYHVVPYLGRLAAVLSGRSLRPLSMLDVFGRLSDPSTARASNASAPGQGPTLRIAFTSMGGSLYVRDYPDRVNPELRPDWPGYPVSPEPRPPRAGVSRKLYAWELQQWRGRVTVERRQHGVIAALLPGPCGGAA